MSKKKDKALTNVINLSLDKLDKMMIGIENSKDWKVCKQDNTSLSFIISILIKELAIQMASMQDVSFVKKELKETLTWVADRNLEMAKEEKKNARLN